MKAIIENIQHFSLHDGPGTRTTVFFKGCPLACAWCSNPTTQKYTIELLYKEDLCVGCQKCVTVCPQNAISFTEKVNIDSKQCDLCGQCIKKCKAQALVMAGKEYDVDELFSIIRKDIMFFQNSGGGVTFSGGEMLSFAPFILEVIAKCKKINIHTCAETSGYGSYEDLKQVVEKLNMVFFDVKHIDSAKHKEITGKENTKILKNLEKLLSEVHTPVHIRLPLIPTLNDDDEHLVEYAKYMSSLHGIADLEILPYHRLGATKYSMIGREYSLSSINPHSSEDLIAKLELMRTHAKNLKILCTG